MCGGWLLPTEGRVSFLDLLLINIVLAFLVLPLFIRRSLLVFLVVLLVFGQGSPRRILLFLRRPLQLICQQLQRVGRIDDSIGQLDRVSQQVSHRKHRRTV